MNQANLDRAVARATGETITQIRKHGFSLLLPEPPRIEPLPTIVRFKHPRNIRSSPQTKRIA